MDILSLFSVLQIPVMFFQYCFITKHTVMPISDVLLLSTYRRYTPVLDLTSEQNLQSFYFTGFCFLS